MELGPLQLEAMTHLWASGEQTVAQVHERLNACRRATGKPELAYTTSLTVLRNLARRGLVRQRHESGKRGHLFTALQTRQELQRQLVDGFVSAVFGGDREALKAFL